MTFATAVRGKRPRTLLAAAIFALTALPQASIGNDAQAAADESRLSGEARGHVEAPHPEQVIVKFKEGATRAEKADARGDEGLRKKEDLGLIGAEVDTVRGQTVEQAVRDLEKRPDVEYAEPDFVVKASQTVANDPDYPRMYGLNNTGQTGGSADADVDAPEAWGVTTGVAEMPVAVIDEGVDISHLDLENNVWTNPDEVAGNSLDDDGNGYVDDLHGWDFVNDDPSVYDPDPVTGAGDEHGTHVAGTIAAQGNNSLGVVGVNWQAKIMPLKFLGAGGRGFTSGAIEALDYAVQEGVKISNNSYGGGSFSQAFKDAIARADAQGHLFVASAGNGGADGIGDNNDVTPHYPSGYDNPNVVSVAATDNKDALAGFSNYGASSVDIAAPGVSVRSTLPKNAYGSNSGTSMATPHVAGVAALLEGKEPALDAAALKDRILRHADTKPGLQGKAVSGARLNAHQSVISTPDAAPAPAPAPAPTYSPPPNYAAPSIASVRPAPTSSTYDNTPVIAATVTDSQTDLVQTNVRVLVDGRARNFAYDGATDRLRAVPTLANGRHVVRIEANDGELSASRSWAFYVR